MKERPLLITILSIISYVSVGLCLLGSLMLFVIASPFDVIKADVPELAEITSTFFVVLAIVSLLSAILYFFIALGFWKGWNWTRILVITLSIIGALVTLVTLILSFLIVDISSIFLNIVFLAIDILVAYYLLFNKKVKKFFM